MGHKADDRKSREKLDIFKHKLNLEAITNKSTNSLPQEKVEFKFQIERTSKKHPNSTEKEKKKERKKREMEKDVT